MVSTDQIFGAFQEDKLRQFTAKWMQDKIQRAILDTAQKQYRWREVSGLDGNKGLHNFIAKPKSLYSLLSPW